MRPFSKLLVATALSVVVPHVMSQPVLSQVVALGHQATGVTVSESGRVFLSFPRWTEDSTISVAELKDGSLVPYPDAGWNAWRNAKKDALNASEHWVCVQSVVADGRGSVWVLDPGAPAMAAVIEGAPKLVQIDLATNSLRRSILFDPTIAPQGSYLNDVRFSIDGKTAFITDSGVKGALVVVDLDKGTSRRVLDGHPSTQADKTVVVTYDGKPLRRPDGRGVDFSADGLALSNDGLTLFWQAIKGKTLYSIATEALAHSNTLEDIAKRVVVVGVNGPADGLLISKHDGKMYVTSPQDDSIKVRDLTKPGSGLVTVIRDPRLRWPDTFAEGPDGTLYFTTSHIQDSAFFTPNAPAALPTQLWSLKLRTSH